jgi:putative colanic acid biosynthesis UDP-glucose lipid carrier transferase
MITISTLILKSESTSTGDRKVLREYVDEKTGYLIFKRIFDILFSACFLLFVGLWLFPLVAILVWLDSKGPVFFVQNRVGKAGKSFRCIKFRTMIVNREANKKQAEVNDYRITRIGHFLRNSSIDEIPQFINVLMGHMSVVGPRPHMHSDCSRFGRIVTGYKFRNFVKPGITGLAQVKGFRGPAADFGSIFHRYQYDAFYVRNCNFWLDMRIVRKTISQTVRGFFLKKFVAKPEPDNHFSISLEKA